MIMIDNQWENVDTLEDVYKIIKDKLGDELRYKIEEIIGENYLSKELNEALCEIDNMSSDICTLEEEVSSLESIIERLEEEIEELKTRKE